MSDSVTFRNCLITLLFMVLGGQRREVILNISLLVSVFFQFSQAVIQKSRWGVLPLLSKGKNSKKGEFNNPCAFLGWKAFETFQTLCSTILQPKKECHGNVDKSVWTATW